jgi:hypothetical protein
MIEKEKRNVITTTKDNSRCSKKKEKEILGTCTVSYYYCNKP